MVSIRLLPIVVACLATCAAVVGMQPAAAQGRVTLETIPTFGGDRSNASAINDAGQVTGFALRSDGASRAFVWQRGTPMRDLGIVSGHVGSVGTGINNLGQVVGYSDIEGDGSSYRAIRWTSTTGMQVLGQPAPYTSSLAFDINDSGQVVGWARRAGNFFDPVVWSTGSPIEVVNSPFDEPGSASARGINASGVVAGQLSTGSNQSQAFRYNTASNILQMLGSLGGPRSEAWGINDAGWAVGQSLDANGRTRPVLWGAGASMTELSTPQGFIGTAQALNSAGQIVGGFQLGPDRGAALWRSDGSMTDLRTLVGPDLRPIRARGISRHAQVVGEAVLASNGQERGFVMTLHPDWTGGDGAWDDTTGNRWNWAGTGTAAARVGAMHDVAIDPGISATVRGSANGQARELRIGGTARQLVTLDLAGGTTTVERGATVATGGILAGRGRLQGDTEVQCGGRIGVVEGQTMQLAGTLSNHGNVDVQGLKGTARLEVADRAVNRSDGQIDLNHAQVVFADGLDNSGRLSVSGDSTVAGAISNRVNARIQVSGPAADVLFWDTMQQDGLVIVTAGSTASFFGRVRGTGDFSGAGAKYFAGGYEPGNSAAEVQMSGEIRFDAGDVAMELGGTAPGTQHDRLVFEGGSVFVSAGTVNLRVSWLDGYTGQAGDTFDLFDWNGANSTLSGQFGQLMLPALAPGLHWDTSRLYTDGLLAVAVPEPSSCAVLLLGLAALGAMRRRATATMPARPSSIDAHAPGSGTTLTQARA
jgi:probable HAF family extracellular repeat protein